MNHPADDGMITVERVSRAAVIRVARAVRFKNVVDIVFQTAKAQALARRGCLRPCD